MARCPIVRPDSVRLPLSDGDFIDVKRRLNAGEYREMIAAQFKDAPSGDRPSVDFRMVGLSKIEAYLLGWSFVDLDGQAPLSVSRETILKIDPETFAEVLTAVEQHHDASEAEADARKNARGGENGSSATSPSPSTTAGATNG